MVSVTAQYNGYWVSSPGGKVAGALTTHPHLALRLKKGVELSSTSPLPLGLQGLLQDEFTFYIFPMNICVLYTH
jgi:hypothetical protein